MIRNKIEVEIILTDSGNLRLCSNGASYLIEKFSPLSVGLEVDLLYSLGIMDKMKIKEGDSIISGGHYGIVTKAPPFDEFITIKTNDDEKEYSISRKNVDLAQVSRNDGNTMLYAVSELSESKLKIAFHLLFGEEWRKYQPDKDKAEEMKAIFKGGVKPCVSFENWVKCIDFLRTNCI